jgi:hypothetical protein
MNYVDFNNGPVRSIFVGLGEDWANLLGHSESFQDLRRSVVERNDRNHGGFVKAARRQPQASRHA